MPDYFIIEAGDVEYLKALKTRLYSEITMDADTMRDHGNRLVILIDNLLDLKEGG